MHVIRSVIHSFSLFRVKRHGRLEYVEHKSAEFIIERSKKNIIAEHGRF